MTDTAPRSARETRLLAPPSPGRRGAWSYALRTTNPPPDRPVASLDGVTRWLVVTRAAVLPMTVFAGLVAGLLAVRADGFRSELWALALLGITLAHTANNLMNDLSDTDVGLDTEQYPRALYAPHPLLSGLVTKKQLIGAILGDPGGRPRHHARALQPARLAGGGVRAGRAVPVVRLHRPAASG